MENDIDGLLLASIVDIRRGQRALVGACAFGGDVRAWCRHEGVAVRAHVHSSGVVAGVRMSREVEAAGGGPELLGRIAGAARGAERGALVRVHARWLRYPGEGERSEARRAWVRGAVATDPRDDVADALRKEIGRAMEVAEIELRADVAHCLRIGIRPAELRRVADVPNLSALLARSSSFCRPGAADQGRATTGQDCPRGAPSRSRGDAGPCGCRYTLSRRRGVHGCVRPRSLSLAKSSPWP